MKAALAEIAHACGADDASDGLCLLAPNALAHLDVEKLSSPGSFAQRRAAGGRSSASGCRRSEHRGHGVRRRVMPSAFNFDIKVVAFIPRSSAAPPAP